MGFIIFHRRLFSFLSKTFSRRSNRTVVWKFIFSTTRDVCFLFRLTFDALRNFGTTYLFKLYIITVIPKEI